MRHRDAAEAEELHALDYMAYSYLQEAQDAEAKKIVDIAAKVKKTNPELEFSAAYALAAIPTRMRLSETIGQRRQTCHSESATLVFVSVHGSSYRIWSRAGTRAHRRRRRRAKSDRTNAATTRCDERAKIRLFQKSSRPTDASSFGVGGSAEGKENEASDLLRRAADSEEILGKHPVSPASFVPIREQLGTLLLEMGQPKEAQREFEARSRFILGDSEVCMERREPPSWPATMRMQAATTRS